MAEVAKGADRPRQKSRQATSSQRRTPGAKAAGNEMRFSSGLIYRTKTEIASASKSGKSAFRLNNEKLGVK
jgi:hypothetical protein